MSLGDLDALATAALVRSGQVSPLEVIDAAIARLEAADADLNFVVTEDYERARVAAARVAPDAPLAGVPVVLKDFLATCAGLRHTEGSRFLESYVPTRDSTYVERLKRAGATVLATTAVPELALVGTTEPRAHGATRNPWDVTRSAGGSSGGSAVAVASGAVPVAHGNDCGGSIRCPASFCGAFGLKPTRSRNPLGPDHGDLGGGIWAEHVITHSVRDSAAFLDATAGAAIGDPHIAPAPARSFREAAGMAPARLRLGVSPALMDQHGVAAACRRATAATARLCEELGHDVVELDLTPVDFPALGAAFEQLIITGAARRVDFWERRLGRRAGGDDLEPLTTYMVAQARGVSAVELLHALDIVQREARQLAHALDHVDAWLTPAVSRPPIPLGWIDTSDADPTRAFARDMTLAPFLWLANATGRPAMSVPLGTDDDGLPIGSHFTGRFGDETTLFSLAAQLEEARPWNRAPRRA